MEQHLTKQKEKTSGTVRFLAAGGLILTTMIWGGSFVAMKTSMELVPPAWLLAIRFSLAALLMGLLFHRALLSAPKEAWKKGMILGCFLELSYLFQTYGLQFTTASKNAFITTLYVVLVPLLLWGITKKRPGTNQPAAAVLAVIGLALLSLEGDFSINLGDGLTLLCSLSFAVHMILIDRYTKDFSLVVLTTVQIGTAAALSWCLAPVLDGGLSADFLTADGFWTGMFYLVVLATMGGFLLQNLGQKYVSANTSAILLSLESVFGALFSVLLLHEKMTGRMIIGCGFLFAAVLLAEVKFEQIVVYCRKTKRGQGVCQSSQSFRSEE